MEGVFSGLKVVDAASYLAAPCAATILSDYGADVIKIEPLQGDQHRGIAANHPADWSWQLTARNRRSLAMDLATDEGHAVLMEILAKVDVFVVNFSASQLRKFNLEWSTLRPVNPRLVLAQISGFGNEGPEADRRAYDLTGWFARTGILDLMREKDVAPSPPPGGVGDHATGLALYAAILTALYKRERTGEGSMVSTSLAATGTWANGLLLQGAIAGVDFAARRNREGWSNPVQNVYTTLDGRHILIAVQNVRRDLPKLVDTLGVRHLFEEHEEDPVKVFFKKRVAARQVMATAFGKLDADTACAKLDAAGIVHSLVQINSEVIKDEQLHANEVFVPFDSGKPGCEATLASPFQVSNESQCEPRRAPEIGEHSEEILRDFGLSPEQIAALRARGIVN